MSLSTVRPPNSELQPASGKRTASLRIRSSLRAGVMHYPHNGCAGGMERE